MKRLALAVACLSACSPPPEGGGAADAVPSAPVDAASGAATTVIPAADALARTFRPLDPGSPGVPQIAVLDGDPERGPSLALFRYGPDYEGSGRPHTHAHAYRSWLVEGQMKHWGASGSQADAEPLGPGSYWRQPVGQLHADNCLSERCTAYVAFDGPVDADFPDGH